MSEGSAQVVVRPGPGIVARHGDAVMVVLDGGTDEVRSALLDALEQAGTTSATPGRALARRLVGLLSQSEPEAVPAFGACAPSERGWAVILHQGVALHVAGGNPSRLSGYDASTWVDRIVDDGFASLTLAADGAEVGEVDHRYRFQGGIIPGGGATVLPGDQMAAQPSVDQQPMAEQQMADQQPMAEPPTVVDQPNPLQQQPVQQQPQPVQQQPQPVQQQPQPVQQQPQPVQQQPVQQQPQPVQQPPVQAPVPAPVAPDPLPSRTPEAAPTPTPSPLFGTPDPGPQAAPVAAQQADEPPTLIQQPDRAPEPEVVQAPPEALPEEDVPFESVPLADIGPEAKREPLPVLSADTPKEEVEDSESPLVYGVLSPAGYFNHPDALYCSVTGVSMLHRTHVLVQRPRPPLGVVVADDGSTYTLNKNYVVGREPERDPMVESDQARPLKLSDAERSLSRVHAEIRLVDWDVFIVDRGSANGTYVLPRGGQQWKRLVADTPEKIVPGTRVAFGKRVITYETHHQVNQAAS